MYILKPLPSTSATWPPYFDHLFQEMCTTVNILCSRWVLFHRFHEYFRESLNESIYCKYVTVHRMFRLDTFIIKHLFTKPPSTETDPLTLLKDVASLATVARYLNIVTVCQIVMLFEPPVAFSVAAAGTFGWLISSSPSWTVAQYASWPFQKPRHE